MSTGALIYKIRRAMQDQLTRLQEDVIRGAYSHEEYLRLCGSYKGVEWALTELNEVVSTYNPSDDDSLDDELIQIHD
jgi:hypothetical protein